MTGIVRVVGSAPVNVQVVLETEAGRSIRLTGPLRAELERLSGVQVVVRGEVTDAPDPLAAGQLEATSYDVVAVDGRAAVLGEVVAASGSGARLRTASGEELQLSNVPPGFRVGQKVWVQGPRTLAVQSYGVVRQ